MLSRGLLRAGSAMVVAGILGVVSTPGAVAAEPGDLVDLGGTPVDGATSLADATPIEAGLWSDTLGSNAANSTHYFSYRRTVDDSSVHVSVVGSSVNSSDRVSIDLLGEDDTNCWNSSDSANYSNPTLPFGTAGVAGPDEAGDRESSCLRSPEVRFSVTRSTSDESELEYAIKVVEEAPLKDGASAEGLPSPSAPSGSPTIDPPKAGSEGDHDGGLTFDDAFELTSSASVSPELSSGEVRFFKVHLDWGQKLSVGADAPRLDESAIDTWGYSTSMLVRVYNPMRGVTAPGDGAAFDNDVSLSSDEPVTATTGAGPVQYRGRFGDDTSYLPGDYWIAVSLRGTGDNAAAGKPIPVNLTIKTAGDDQGAPTYSRARPFLIGPDTWSAEPSGYAESTADAGETSTARRVGAGALALVGLLCLGLAGVRLRRRPV